MGISSGRFKPSRAVRVFQGKVRSDNVCGRQVDDALTKRELRYCLFRFFSADSRSTLPNQQRALANPAPVVIANHAGFANYAMTRYQVGQRILSHGSSDGTGGVRFPQGRSQVPIADECARLYPQQCPPYLHLKRCTADERTQGRLRYGLRRAARKSGRLIAPRARRPAAIVLAASVLGASPIPPRHLQSLRRRDDKYRADSRLSGIVRRVCRRNRPRLSNPRRRI